MVSKVVRDKSPLLCLYFDEDHEKVAGLERFVAADVGIF